MTTNWTRFVRAVVHGEYFLKEFETEHHGAGVFRASDSAGRDVDVHLLSAEATNAGTFQEHWSATASLSHPGLLRTLAFGTVRIDGAEFLCAVSEAPEERLADVLAVRSLTADEAHSVLEGTLEALEYLHNQKYLHGAYSPESIVARDDRAKLTTAAIRKFSASTPEDRKAFIQEIKQVGDCAVRMLSKPGNVPLPATSIPPEFTMLLRTASMGDERWSPTAVDLRHALKGVNIQPKEEAATPPPDQVSVVKPAPVPNNIAPVALPPEPEQKEQPLIAPPAARESRSPQFVVVAAALIVALVAFIYFAWPSPRTDEVETKPVRRDFGARARTTEPPAAAKVQPEPPQPAETVQRVRGEGEWAVVAATYNDRKAAIRRAEQLGRRWRAAKPEVVPPHEGARRYLVVLGSGMSKEAANRLWSRARSSGMPRDSYVTKLSW